MNVDAAGKTALHFTTWLRVCSMTKRQMGNRSREAVEKDIKRNLDKLSLDDLRAVLSAAALIKGMSNEEFAEWRRSIASPEV